MKQAIITESNLVIWLDKFKEYWIKKDIDSLLSIFNKTEKYFEDPFSSPGTSIDDIRSFWKEIKEQNIISLRFTPLAIDGHKVIVNWRFKYSEINELYKINELDGVYFILFNDNLECLEFKQWWISKE